MGSVHNTIDKFSRRKSKDHKLIPKNIELKRSPYERYDLLNKRLENVGDPQKMEMKLLDIK